MKHQVLVIAEAEEDIFDIYKYVLRADGRGRADDLLVKLQETCQSLVEMPRRGHSPPELKRVGVRGYREIHFKPYRIIYQIVGRKVFIHCVLDGRRSLQEVLERRLLR
ncbi:MAG: type II toxin-antitoxin system RelE/ParE family toxin [Sedimentisphaerales bacterium]|nr:type II toxin-antitoxin system RelE/ParE family toxin [Sedimentisphaerales bacterium]